MFQKLFTIITISLLLLACGKENNPSSPNGNQLTSLEKDLVESDNQFSLKLFKEVVRTEEDTNIFISPLSVSMALGMTLNGAANETQLAMQSTLEFGDKTTDEINQAYRNLIDFLTQLDPKVVFDIANSIWYRQEMAFEQVFLDANQTYFDALVKPVDFNQKTAVAEQINNWVKDNTNNKIDKILNPGDIKPESVMFLLNAIYFLGTWQYEFDKQQTYDAQFNYRNGSGVPCKMMVQRNEYNYLENDDFQAIDLPYGDGTFTMTIFLPKWGKDLDLFIANLTNDNWNNWTQSFQRDSVQFEMPKFKLEYDVKLNDMLITMGMGVAFTGAADFTRMYAPGNLFISYVKHKTFVRVDEEGTEAAAVTIVAIELTAVGPSSIKYMRVDRPFVFTIRENQSGAILFMGKVVNPIWEE